MKKTGSRTDALYAAVYASPADDASRAVLADHLQELGDPRGDFIALQLAKLARKPTAAATRRERALLAEHRAAWLGPLAKIVNEPHSTWERGFLAVATAELDARTPADPRWNTVRSLRLIGARTGAHPVLGAGCFAALTELGMIDVEAIQSLLANPPPIDSLVVYGPTVPPGAQRWFPKQLGLVNRLVELPRLARLKLHVARHPWDVSHLDWVWKSPAIRRLRHLELELSTPLDAAGCLRAVAALTNLETFTLACTLFELRFERDTGGAFTRLTAVWSGLTDAAAKLTHLVTPLRGLPTDALTTFRFEHPTARWLAARLQPLRNAVARQVRIRS